MAYKIHKRGAFVIIENTVNGEIKELNSQYVQITKGKTSLDQYEVLYNGVSQLKAVLGDIQDANGVAYVEADWDIFRYEQCGSVNSSEVANPYPAPTTVEVDITSAQILNMGSSPIELLPAAGAGKYYEFKIILEFTNCDTYTGNSCLYIDNGGGDCYKAFYDWNEVAVNVAEIHSHELGNIDVSDPDVGAASYLVKRIGRLTNTRINKPLTLTTWDLADPTLGTGTIRAIITYTTRTFGA